MIDETQTPPQETNSSTKTEDNFTAILRMQSNDQLQRLAAEHAHSIVEAQPLEPLTPRPQLRKKALVFGAGVALVLGGAGVVADHLLPAEEIASASTNVENGEGIKQSVYRNFNELKSKGIYATDAHNPEDVMYQAIKIHTDKNNVVQPGEPVEVIATKSAIFGSVAYEAVDDRQQTESK